MTKYKVSFYTLKYLQILFKNTSYLNILLFKDTSYINEIILGYKMSNETITKAIIGFSIGRGLYRKDITDENVPDDVKNEFWDKIDEFREPILHILKGADMDFPAIKMKNKTPDERVKGYLGNLEWIANKKTRTIKPVWIWNSNLRSLAKIYGIKL